MQEVRTSRSSVRGDANAIGLAWHLGRWDGQPVIGHDGGTVGQTAYLRVAPQARVAACLLTNASSSDSLYHELFTEVFAEFAGISPPAGIEPAAEPEDLVLHPCDTTGDRFVGRSRPEDRWAEFIFSQLADGTPYLHVGGRLNPRVG